MACSSSLTNLLATLRAGLGITVLPCLLCDVEPDLLRCVGPLPGMESEVWLLTREELRDVPRIRLFLDFLAAQVLARRAFLSGAAGAG